MHRRLVYIYLLNVPSISSRYFNKIKRTSRLGRSLEILCALFNLHFIALPAVIHLVCLSEGKELLRFQHFRSTKTINKFLNAWGKIISAETLLDENMFVACM